MINLGEFNGVTLLRDYWGESANGEYAVSFDGGLTFEWTGVFRVEDIREFMNTEYQLGDSDGNHND